MSKGIRKAIISNNPKIRKVLCTVNGTAGTPAATGLDASQILSVTDNSAGNYTIILKYPFNPNSSALPIGMVTSLTDSVSARVAAVAYDRVTVACWDTTSGVATDCDFNLELTGNDNRLTY